MCSWPGLFLDFIKINDIINTYTTYSRKEASTLFEDYSASDLAGAIDSVQTQSAEYTGSLSMLDEAALKWSGRYPELRAAHQRFAAARQNVWPHSLTDETWAEMKAAAAALAVEFRKLGDVTITYCDAPSKYGSCPGVLDEHGNCAFVSSHR